MGIAPQARRQYCVEIHTNREEEAMTEVKMHKAIFAYVLVAIILVPVSFDRDPAGRSPGLILSWTESRAGAGNSDLSGKAGLHNSRPSDAKGGSIGSHLTPLEVRQLLASHNRAREEVGLSPLVWSNVLAAYAQKWADHLASTSGLMEHRPHSGRWKQEHGENLFMGTAGYYGVADAVIAWEREKNAYHGRVIDQSNVHDCGHYTQLIWKNTKRIGCAKVRCEDHIIVVCNYDPPGNVLGQTPY